MLCHTTSASLLSVALLAMGALAPRSPAQAPSGTKALSDTARPLPVDPAVTIGRLPNGVRYYIRVNHKPEQRAELRLVVNAGSVLEDDDQRGLAHMVEHMAFNGTTHFKKGELVNYLESIGMRFGPDLNAYTSFDETVYMLTIPTDTARVVDRSFQILADWAHGQTFDSAAVERERGVVTEEWRLGQGAGSRLRDKQFPIIFQNSKYAERLPIGTKHVLDTFSRAALVRFYKEWYRPDLMAVVAVGDFDKAHIEQLIRTHFGAIPAAAKPTPRPLVPVPDNKGTLFAIATDKEATATSISVYYKQPVRSQTSVGAYREGLVEELFNSMLNQRLYELTQKPDAPFLGASSSQGRFVRSKEVYVLGAGVKDDGAERGLEALLTEAQRVEQFGFTQSELDRTKTNLLRGLEQANAERDKTNSGVFADEYVQNYLEGDPIPGIAAGYGLAKAMLPGITLAEIDRLARRWITDTNRVVVLSAPDKPGVTVPSARALLAVFDAVGKKRIAAYTDVVSDKPLLDKAPAPAAVTAGRTIPEIGVAEWTLANGVHVLVKPTDFKADEVLMSAYALGGTSLAADSNLVPATLAAQVTVLSGVGSFDRIELQKKLAGKAVSVTPTISELSEGFAGRASPRDLETMLQLVYLYFTAPRRDSLAFAAYRSQLRTVLGNLLADPEKAFEDTVQVTLAQHHPRARPITPAFVDEMNLDRSAAFYRARFADASGFTFVFVGSIDTTKLKPLVQRYLGGLPAAGKPEHWRDVGVTFPTGVIKKTVYRGVEPKAETRLIFTGPFDYSRENRYAMQSLADLLSIKLREALRDVLGGTYSVSVSADPSKEPRVEYSIVADFGSAPERAEELTRVLLQHIDSVKQHGASPQDLEKVKEAQRRERETALRQNGYWLGQLSAKTRYHEDPREILTYEQLIDGLTSDMIKQAAQRYLRTDNYVQVMLLPETSRGKNPAPDGAR